MHNMNAVESAMQALKLCLVIGGTQDDDLVTWIFNNKNCIKEAIEKNDRNAVIELIGSIRNSML